MKQLHRKIVPIISIVVHKRLLVYLKLFFKDHVWSEASLCCWVLRRMLGSGRVLQCPSFKRKKLNSKCVRPRSLYVYSVQSISENKRNKKLFIQKSKVKNCNLLLHEDSRGCFSWLPLILNSVFGTELIRILQKASSKKVKTAAFKSMVSTIFLLLKLENMFSIIAKYSKTEFFVYRECIFIFKRSYSNYCSNTTTESWLLIITCYIQGLEG